MKLKMRYSQFQVLNPMIYVDMLYVSTTYLWNFHLAEGTIPVAIPSQFGYHQIFPLD